MRLRCVQRWLPGCKLSCWTVESNTFRPRNRLPGVARGSALFVVVIGFLTSLSCQGATHSAARVSPSSSAVVSTVPQTPLASSGPFCPGLQQGHDLLIERLGVTSDQTLLRDVTDPLHGVTICALPRAAPRFVSMTQVALLNPGTFTLLDLTSGVQTPILSYDHNSGPVLTQDWTPDGQLFAYGRLTPDGHSVVFHLVAQGTDRVLTTVQGGSMGIGDVRVEFSPDGQYLALGAPSSQSSGDGAAVQIRRRNGSLLFTSGGSAQLTWADESSPRLYFQSSSGVLAWSAGNSADPTTIAAWRLPIRSAGGRWLAYQVPGTYPEVLRILDTRTGVDRSIGHAPLSAAWVTPTLLRFDDSVSCPSPIPNAEGGNPCSTRPVIYDTSDGSKTSTVEAMVFASWPKGTPAWF